MPAQRLDLKIGDEVDFYREQSNKDTSGWFGPAQVIDVSRAQRGVVTVRWRSLPLECQLSDLRRHLQFFVYLASYLGTSTPHNHSWQFLRRYFNTVKPGSFVHIGNVHHDGRWIKFWPGL